MIANKAHFHDTLVENICSMFNDSNASTNLFFSPFEFVKVKPCSTQCLLQPEEGFHELGALRTQGGDWHLDWVRCVYDK